MVWVIVGLLAINVISFLMFAARRTLDKIRFFSGINGISDELSGIVAIGGSFGAFIAMCLFKKGTEFDIVFKIVVPISMVIQTLTIGYLFLFDLGVVK